jgi:hypothetical protein
MGPCIGHAQPSPHSRAWSPANKTSNPSAHAHRRLRLRRRRRADGLTQGAAAVRYGAEGAGGEGAEPAGPSALRAHRVAERRADVRRAGRLHHPAPAPAPNARRAIVRGARRARRSPLRRRRNRLTTQPMQCARGPGRAGYFPACNTPPPACARHQEGQSPEGSHADSRGHRSGLADGTRRAMAAAGNATQARLWREPALRPACGGTWQSRARRRTSRG